MHSLLLDGQVLDYQFKRHLEFSYLFYTGDLYQGQVFNMKKRGWSALADKASGNCKLVSGFRTRLDAAEFILQANGYRDEVSKED